MEMSRFSPQNLMLISIFYHICFFIEDHILLGGYKLGDKALDLLGLGAIFIGNGADGDFILDDRHEF